jgi:hypothetical protein
VFGGVVIVVVICNIILYFLVLSLVARGKGGRAPFILVLFMKGNINNLQDPNSSSKVLFQNKIYRIKSSK